MNCEHEWIVYSTALSSCSISVQCSKCEQLGQIEYGDYSKIDWNMAFFAPSQPYPLRKELYGVVKT